MTVESLKTKYPKEVESVEKVFELCDAEEVETGKEHITLLSKGKMITDIFEEKEIFTVLNLIVFFQKQGNLYGN